MADPVLIIGGIAIFAIVFYKIVEENPDGLAKVIKAFKGNLDTKEKKDGILQEEKGKDVPRDKELQQTAGSTQEQKR